jgi:two-component system, cell cycle response regulator
MADLQREVATASRARPLLLMLFDLNGFKAYNDNFGHPAGDALLARLGAALQAAMRGRGSVYRLGGDEFCILAGVGPDGTAPTVAAAEAALTEHGDGFSITASYGAVVLPTDGRDPGEAMRLVDQRMYANKTSGGAPPTARARTCCYAPCTNATPTWPNGSRPPPGWPRPSANAWG